MFGKTFLRGLEALEGPKVEVLRLEEDTSISR
jgi:hypothetical protein